MRKYVSIIGVLVLLICVTLVSDTMALYTKSFDFDLTLTVVPDPNRPIRPEDFLSYEYNTEKICKYAAQSTEEPPKCAQGEVHFNEGQFLKDNTVTVHQDAGAIRNYPSKNGQKKYLVSSRVMNIQDGYWHNFGIYFNGSYLYTKKNVITSGYVLKFLDNGDLVINEEGFDSNEVYPDHSNDSIHHTTVEPTSNLLVASANAIRMKLNMEMNTTGPIQGDQVDMQVRVTENDRSKISVYIYINDILINEPAIELDNDFRKFHQGGDARNNMIGLSTYGEGTVVTFTKLYMDDWNGNVEEMIPVED